MDNDGFDDLAVGAPNAAGGLGRVAVYYGPGDDWSQFMNTTGNFADAYIYSAANYGFLGQRVECGDVNGDGADDLVIGSGQGTVMSQPVNAGVHAFYNTGAQLSGQTDLQDADVRMFFNTAANTQWPSFWLEDVDGDGMKEVLYFMNQNSSSDLLLAIQTIRFGCWMQTAIKWAQWKIIPSSRLHHQRSTEWEMFGVLEMTC